MLAANVSDDKRNYSENVLDRYCSLGIATAIHGQVTFIAVLNAFLSITASLGNGLVLVALGKHSSLHPPSKLLLRSLAVTDLCAGLFSEPLYVTLLVTVVNKDWNICHYGAVTFSATATLLASASLLTLTAISVDRLLALLLGLRYRQVVTLKRTRLIIITFWVLSAGFPTMGLFWNFPIISAIVIPLCLVTSTFSHTKIFFTLRRHQSQLQDHVQQPNQTKQLFSVDKRLEIKLRHAFTPLPSERKKRTTSTERILHIFAKFPNSSANFAFFGTHHMHTAAINGMMCGDMDKYMFFF